MHILDNTISFPHPDTTHESGVLAIGGDLHPDRLILAYQYGIFPWYNEDDPIVWWHPDPRCILLPSEVKVSKSMRTYFNQDKFTITLDQQFDDVMYQCRKVKRKDGEGTWISDDIMHAYSLLHKLGFAHSLEVWEEGELVGGLYGVSLGKVFYGESMFSNVSNASKVALISLAKTLDENGYWLIDCQVTNPHLESMGASHITRKEFLKYMQKNTFESTKQGDWSSMVEDKKLSSLL